MTDLRATFAIKGHPLHPMLVTIPIAMFVATLITDILFVSDGSREWAEASRWLLGAGIVGALLAAIAGFIDFAANARIREFRDAWLHMFANLAAVVVEVVNLVVRVPDADAAGSIGVYLSVVAVLILLFSGWKGGELVFRHGVGRAEPETRIR